MMVWLGRREASVAEVRATVQATVNPSGKEAIEAFSSYVDAMFPYRRNMESRAKESQREVLQKWVGVGQLQVRPQVGTTDRQEPIRQNQRVRGKALLGRARTQTDFKRLEDAWIKESGAGSRTPGRATRPAKLPIRMAKR